MIFHKRKAAIHAYTMNTIFYKIYQSFILTSVFIYCKDVPIVKHAQAVTVTIHHIVELCTKLTIQAKLLHRHISGLWFLSELLCCTSKRLDNVWICLHFPLKKITAQLQMHKTISASIFFSVFFTKISTFVQNGPQLCCFETDKHDTVLMILMSSFKRLW